MQEKMPFSIRFVCCLAKIFEVISSVFLSREKLYADVSEVSRFGDCLIGCNNVLIVSRCCAVCFNKSLSSSFVFGILLWLRIVIIPVPIAVDCALVYAYYIMDSVLFSLAASSSSVQVFRRICAVCYA